MGSHPMPEGAIWIDGFVIDGHGNPLVESDGCPNCGAGAGWGYWPSNDPCSRVCRSQLEFADALELADWAACGLRMPVHDAPDQTTDQYMLGVALQMRQAEVQRV